MKVVSQILPLVGLLQPSRLLGLLYHCVTFIWRLAASIAGEIHANPHTHVARFSVRRLEISISIGDDTCNAEIK